MKTQREYMTQTIEILQMNPEKARNDEAPFILAFRALEYWAQWHEGRFEGTKIGEDYLAREHWLDMARALVGMLNYDHGRLDAGSVDKLVRDLAESCGMTRDLE